MVLLEEQLKQKSSAQHTFNCRLCDTPSKPFISFGKMPIANGFLYPDEFKSEYFFDLAVFYCPDCYMVQLTEQPDPERMFHSAYPFFTSSSKYMQSHLTTLARDYENRYLTSQNPFVVEIGSNDGTLLKHFASKGIRHLGVDPSGNVAQSAQDKGVRTKVAFFSEKVAGEIVADNGQADLVVATNVMCHIPDTHSVIKGLVKLLTQKGVFVFEDPFLGDILKKVSYDQIYDEHVYYFSLHSIQKVFSCHGMEVIDVEPQETHGGSMRYVIARRGEYPVSSNVDNLMAHEKKQKINSIETYDQFRKNCESSKQKLREALSQLRDHGRRIAGYAATSKSTTVLNYCEVGAEDIEFICDTTPMKQGKFSPGVHIPIKPYDAFKANYPDIALLFGWNHQKEILEKEQSFTEQGGQWLVYVPEVKTL